MARTPKSSIFQGISAISDAGGIEGFVREILAEAKRMVMKTARDPETLANRRALRMLLENYVTHIATHRLQPDLDRGFRTRISNAILACESADLVEAAYEAGFIAASVWWQEVIRDTTLAVMPRLDEIIDQVQEDAGPAKEQHA